MKKVQLVMFGWKQSYVERTYHCECFCLVCLPRAKSYTLEAEDMSGFHALSGEQQAYLSDLVQRGSTMQEELQGARLAAKAFKEEKAAKLQAVSNRFCPPPPTSPHPRTRSPVHYPPPRPPHTFSSPSHPPLPSRSLYTQWEQACAKAAAQGTPLPAKPSFPRKPKVPSGAEMAKKAKKKKRVEKEAEEEGGGEGEGEQQQPKKKKHKKEGGEEQQQPEKKKKTKKKKPAAAAAPAPAKPPKPAAPVLPRGGSGGRVTRASARWDALPEEERQAAEAAAATPATGGGMATKAKRRHG